MGQLIPQPTLAKVRALAAVQHGVVARAQLLALGTTPDGINHRIRRGRLWPIHRGVYAFGCPRLTVNGQWMAAVLACGPRAALSHESAAVLWGIWTLQTRGTEVSLPSKVDRRPSGLLVHRRTLGPSDITHNDGIPVTRPELTIIDLATRLDDAALERAISEADYKRISTLDSLLSVLDEGSRRPGVAKIRSLITRSTFRLTDSELERVFIPIALRAGLPAPLTRQHVNGHRVDFHWPDLGLVVETDGGRAHRSGIQQTRDRRRDQAHLAAGQTPVRFTHWQITRERADVERVLSAIRQRLGAV